VIKPIVAKTFPLAKAAEALRYLIEGRPRTEQIGELVAMLRGVERQDHSDFAGQKKSRPGAISQTVAGLGGGLDC
jgi:hypothetical protein